MQIATIAALVVGLLTGLLFRPLALVPCTIVLLIAFILMRNTLDISVLSLVLICIVMVNVGYLLGTLIHRFTSRN